MTCADLQAANFDPWESVQSVLEKLPESPPEHARWLVRHILETKLEYASLIAGALSRCGPPEGITSDLSSIMAWEVREAETLTPTDLTQPLRYCQRTMTVGEVLSLNARHSVWHAGQLAALLGRCSKTL